MFLLCKQTVKKIPIILKGKVYLPLYLYPFIPYLLNEYAESRFDIRVHFQPLSRECVWRVVFEQV